MNTLNDFAGRPVSEVPPNELRVLINDMVKDAMFFMNEKPDKDYFGQVTGWAYNYLNERYGYMPMSHVNAAFKFGSAGERGGTSKLIPRNISIWLRSQNEVFQEQVARMARKQDEERRRDEMNNYKPSDGFVAHAVVMKVSWLADGRITSEEYDTFSSKVIYDLLKSGVPEKQIHPRDIIPDYDFKRQK